ncbi:hypothetical protein WH52_04940 [Tenacibaculum holothuriorum]|uniref:Polysaccharide biosynthesis protein C-terminal domain-containing protein n=1 Tax=Tenacibaculum holothuriorum TaxID=1635173 RepID=A0A1Y2PGT3_9FLAO|nr:hypothetical protein [Tenacibaculum holothuriorum]OSY89007.1 hypothetical protein WH52_04940 [Tenacibaculum holothuriorum]
MSRNTNKNIILLQKQIQHKIGVPVSVDTVVAIIESFGIRDKDVQSDYGTENIRHLAKKLFAKLTSNSEKEVKNAKEIEFISNQKEERTDFIYEAYQFFKHYVLGTSHLLAIAIQLVTIVLFGFALYVFTGFNQVQSTAVVLGVILGMILSGGFIKVIGKEISTYYYSEDLAMVKQITFYLLKKGILCIALGILFLLTVNFLFSIFPNSMMLVTSIYAFLIGVLFLVFAPLHVLKARILILISTGIATFFGILLFTYTSINIYGVHFLGLSLAIVITVVFLLFYFKRLDIKYEKKDYKLSALLYNNYNYFLYGLIINIYFFIDRILAWSSYKVSNFFFPIYYEKDYEIGMDIAIIFFLLLAGSLEYSSVSFVKLLNKEQHTTSLINSSNYSEKLFDLYLKNTSLLFITAAPIFVIVQYFIYGEYGYNHFFTIPLNPLNTQVAQAGIIGYFFMCWGMLNASYLITLKQQKKVLQLLIIATIVNIIIGFILSKLIAYDYSVYGMLIGSVVFTALSLKENIKVFKNVDYYYYASC